MENKVVISKKIRYKVFVRYLFVLFFLIGVGLQFCEAKEYTVKNVPNVRLTDRNQYVSNPDGIIEAHDVARINELLRTLEDSLGVEVAVVALSNIGDMEPRMFANELFKEWGIGKKEKDNGLLIQLVTVPGQRSIVFETGYGLEGILPDAVAARLQQKYMMPDLRAGRYSQAMVSGVAAVKNYLFANDHDRNALAGTQDDSFMKNMLLAALLLFFFVLVLILFTYRRHPNRVCPRCGKKTLKYAGQQIVQEATNRTPGMVEDVYRCTNCGYTEHNNRHNYRLGGSLFPFIIGAGLGGLGRGFGGGFGGGGFGGGSWGGGASGGGGAIGRF